MTTQRPIPTPAGTVDDITRIRVAMSHRYREQQPEVNQPYRDTVPGAGSGDQ
jgi:hypothetical protein